MTSKILKIVIGDCKIIVDRKSVKNLDLSSLFINAKGYVKLGQKYLHRILMNAPPNMEVDHIDRDKLNNRLSNLRLCTRKQNLRNRSKLKNNSTGFKGVDFTKETKNYRARIMADNKRIYLGNFKNAAEAGAAYEKAAKKYHGEFAYKEPKPRKTKRDKCVKGST